MFDSMSTWKFMMKIFSNVHMILHFLQFHSKWQVFSVKSLYDRSYLQKRVFFCLDSSGQ